jgi:hypothetical protein
VNRRRCRCGWRALRSSTPQRRQLTSTTVTSGTDLNLRWPYQAMVMNTFEQARRIIGASWGQSPDTSEAGGISTSRGVAKRDGLTGRASSRRVNITSRALPWRDRTSALSKDDYPSSSSSMPERRAGKNQPSIQCLKIIVVPCPGRPVRLRARACTRSRCRSGRRRPGCSRLGGRATGRDRSPYYATAPETR